MDQHQIIADLEHRTYCVEHSRISIYTTHAIEYYLKGLCNPSNVIYVEQRQRHYIVFPVSGMCSACGIETLSEYLLGSCTKLCVRCRVPQFVIDTEYTAVSSTRSSVGYEMHLDLPSS